MPIGPYVLFTSGKKGEFPKSSSNASTPQSKSVLGTVSETSINKLPYFETLLSLNLIVGGGSKGNKFMPYIFSPTPRVKLCSINGSPELYLPTVPSAGKSINERIVKSLASIPVL